jgi:transposase-like protein
MITCPTCQQAPTKRDGRDHRGRQRYACRPCHRDFTAGSSSIFAGYRWPLTERIWGCGQAVVVVGG